MSKSTECPIPSCHNLVWAARGLPVCGDCAKMIAFVMTDPQEIEERRSRIFELETKLVNRDHIIESLRATQSKREPAKAPTEGTVYYVQIGSRIKIGWTSNMTNRMRTYPPDSTLLATHPGTRKDEQRMHRRFATDRTHGREWYVPSVSLTHHIEATLAEHGRPDAVNFGAKPLTVYRPRGSRPTGSTSTKLGRAM